jgi:hypothetical protein
LAEQQMPPEVMQQFQQLQQQAQQGSPEEVTKFIYCNQVIYWHNSQSPILG